MSNQNNNQRRNNNRGGGGGKGGGGNRNRNHNNRNNNRNRDQNRDRKPAPKDSPAENSEEKQSGGGGEVDARNVVFKNILFILLILGSVLFIPKWNSSIHLFGFDVSGFAVGMTGLLLLYLVLSFWFLKRVRD